MSNASNICSRCAGSMLAPPRFIGRVPCALYRSGNASTPNLTKLRPHDAIPYNKARTDHVQPPPYDQEWSQNTFPGASTFDQPFWTSGVDETGSQKKYRHFAWLPNIIMPYTDYIKKLEMVESKRSPPLDISTQDAWVLLPKSSIPPNNGKLQLVPENIHPISRIILGAMEKAITTLEAQAAGLGETDEALAMCDAAMSFRHWYHVYLAGKESSFMDCIPTFNIAGVFARGYHTMVQRPRKIPPLFLPVLRIEKKEATRLWDAGKEDESLDLSDTIMFMEGVVSSGLAP